MKEIHKKILVFVKQYMFEHDYPPHNQGNRGRGWLYVKLYYLGISARYERDRVNWLCG